MIDAFGIIFDLETTGVDVFEDRIVTAYIGLMDRSGNIVREQNWIVDPGIPIPEGAARVHGYTTERVKAEANATPATTVQQIHDIIAAECANGGLPLIGANLAYDLSLLESERRRHAAGLPPLRFHREGTTGGIRVFDTYVADKAIDRYRKGSRKLIDTARHYGVPLDEAEAHASSFDAIAAGRIALKMIQNDRFRGMPFDVIHEFLEGAKADQARSLAEYLAKKGKTEEVDPGWPLHTGLAA